MFKSQSIPITRTRRDHFDSRLEDEEQEQVMIADFKDYVFYNRLVSGMTERQQSSKFIDLRNQNQALIHHLTITRNSHTPQELRIVAPHTTSLTSLRRYQLLSCLSNTLELLNDDDNDDELIFEMDL